MTMLKRVLLVAAGAASLVLPPLASAEVSYKPPSGNQLPRILVSGQIKREDLKDFLALAGSARVSGRAEGVYVVDLDSIGGDVETALAMGRILRLDQAWAGVPNNRKCFSSCVFVLAGAPRRYVDGAVGIHRPYWPVDNATTVSAQRLQYERLEKEVKAFLQEINIPAELYDHMIRIPPGKVKVLSPDELQRYGLNEDDPYVQAAGVARTAKVFGVSSQEFMRREAKAKAECPPIAPGVVEVLDENAGCRWRILKEGR